MVIKFNGKLYSDREYKKEKQRLEKIEKKKKIEELKLFSKKIYFIDKDKDFNLYEGYINKKDGEYYIIEVRNRNIYSNGKLEQKKVLKSDVKFN